MQKTATPRTVHGLTLEDIAILVDGRGDVPDDTAERLAPLIAADERFARVVAELRQMADDAGVELLTDGLFVFRCLERLWAEDWKQPTDVLDPRIEIPYSGLILMTEALAERAEADDRLELRQLKRKLLNTVGADLAKEECFQRLVARLLTLDEAVAEHALGNLVEEYGCRRSAGEEARPLPGSPAMTEVAELEADQAGGG